MANVKTIKKVPASWRPFLWSYDFERLDLEKDKRRIILNLLNYGTKKATDVLRNIYSQNDIKKIIENSAASEWEKKSLNYWSLIFNTAPKNKKRIS